ncbi:Cytochrome P450 [Macleaya cordata]|uniref:Cytochrome P450 n=1 Tax=Macleaya cordata TaxID=56857 RepID=A0A200QD39_MACCD|nr:Cytochrome P450 [Macleaya cordata]
MGLGFMTVVFMTVPSFVLLCCAVRVFYTIWWKPKNLEKLLKQQGIKGTPYKILHGDRNDYVRSMQEASSKPMNLTHCIAPRVAPFTLEILQTYGKISVFWFGTTPRVIIWDPEMIKEILSNKFGHFQKPPLNPLIELLSTGLTSLENDIWAKRRRIMTPAFHLEKLKEMAPGFTTSCTKLIDRLNSLVSPGGSSEVDVWPELQNFTGDVISRSAFGSSFEEGKKIFELQKEQAILAIEASQSLYFPGLRYIPTKKNKRRMNLDKEMKAMIRELIDKKEQAMRNGKSSSDDLLGLLLQCNNPNDQQGNVSNSNSTIRMTTEEVIEECKLFYIAGQETTSAWLTWTMVVLSMHPDWQEKAREEVFRVCGKNPPKFEAMNHLKIVNMILYEVLRLYPPVIDQLRHTYKKIKVGEIEFPAGVTISLPTIVIHHDPEFWGEDVEEFKPERFSEGVSKATTKEKAAAFFPFGWGPRICLGQNFAILEAKMALAMILQHFSFELSPSYTHAPHTIITLQPQHGAPIILHRL